MAAAIALLLPFVASMLLCRRLYANQHWLFALPWAAPLAIGSSSVVWWGLMQLRLESQRTLIAADTGIWLALIGVLLLRREGASHATPGLVALPSSGR